jgi:hypothetical protein
MGNLRKCCDREWDCGRQQLWTTLSQFEKETRCKAPVTIVPTAES